MRLLNISLLYSGGLITNYYCTSQCRHCLYGCSPKWPKKYINKERTRENFSLIKSLGCYSVHIGGGEPLLDTARLEDVLFIAKEEGMHIEYVETNSSWYKNDDSALKILGRLKRAGLTTLLVSISPFHNEHITFSKVKGVINVCRASGISVFPWIQEFYPELDMLDDSVTHKLDEFKSIFGEDYLRKIPSRYWIHYGGRAIQTYKEIYPLRPTEEILDANGGCDELENTSHFHADLFGNYLPGLCSGLAIILKDLGKPLNADEYPLITALYNNGIRELLKIATSEYGFKAEKEYLNKCHLCFDIRKYMVKKKGVNSKELQPVDYYDNV